MNRRQIKIFIGVILTYMMIAAIFYVVVKDQYSYSQKIRITETAEAVENTGPILKSKAIVQKLKINQEILSGIGIFFGTYNRENTSKISVTILQSGKELYNEKINASLLKDNQFYELKNREVIKLLKDQEIEIKIVSDTNEADNTVAVWLKREKDLGSKLFVGEDLVDGTLLLDLYSANPNNFGKYYLGLNIVVIMCMGLYFAAILFGYSKIENSYFYKIYSIARKYQFLIEQLVNRDFKTKYRRSFLGIVWSLLNPLLTMAVQYIVFSKIFRFDIDNYIIYLLIGIIVFNFFSEATNQTISIIINNAGLITKVYIPKIIYPVSKVMSVSVNLLLSLIPLLILILMSGLPIEKYYLLLPLGIILFVIFTLGISLILSCMMVFFRDVQFLWGVFVMIWMYLTPIFYPESILTDTLKRIVQFNPLYQYIKYFRMVILEFSAPDVKTILFCILFSVVSILGGYIIFKKHENQFILNI